MKKPGKLQIAGIVLLSIALVIVIVYGSVALATFSRADVDLYEGGKPDAAPVEIIYNSIMFTNGNYQYAIQVYADVDKLTANIASAEAAARIKAAVAAKLGEIYESFTQAGMRVTYEEGSYFVNAVLAEYASYDDISIANGDTGYDAPTSSGKVYTGFWYSDYVVTQTTVFANTEGENWLNFAYEKLVSDGTVSADEIDFVFNYGTAYSHGLIETDADYVYRYIAPDKRVSYVHEFRMSQDERSREITIVQHSPNTASWYLTVITAAIIVTGASLLLTGNRQNKEKGK